VKREFAALQRDCHALGARLDKLTEIPLGIREFCQEQHSALELERRLRSLATRLPQVFTVQPHALDRGMDYMSGLVMADLNDPSEAEVLPAGVLVPRPLLRLKRLHQETLTGLTHEA
jgi:hypothetical protein